MGRFYFSCPQCRTRMIRIHEDVEGQRLFYLCRSCGNRLTYLLGINGISEDWPRDIFDAAVRDGVVTKEGKVL